MPGVLQRFQGLIWGDQVKDSSVYFDGHTLYLDVVGNTSARGFVVRGLNPATNAPTTLASIDKTGTLRLIGDIYATRVIAPDGLNVTLKTVAGFGGFLVDQDNVAYLSWSASGLELPRGATVTDAVTVQDGTTPLVTIKSANASGGFVMSTSNGTLASPTATQANDLLASFAGGGYETTTPGYTASKAVIQFKAAENFTNTAQGTYIVFETTAAGGTTRAERVRIVVGVQVGTPTGGDKGAGTINVAGDVYKNNTAYTNPDYVFEHWATGQIARYAANERAAEYGGLRPLAELRAYVAEHWRFPQIDVAPLGAFGRADVALELIEQTHLYLFDHDDRLATLEARLTALEGARA